MADIRHLLTETDRSADNEEPRRLGDSSRTPDEIIEECIGGFGWAQLVKCILVSLARVFDRQQTFISIFTAAEPTWHCTNSNTCNSSSDICQLSKSSWAWDGSLTQTIVSEWGLECSNSLILSSPASSFFFGSLLGCFFLAALADSSLGRKKLLILSCLTMSTAAFAIIFSTNRSCGKSGVMILVLGIGTVHYGIPMGVENLGFNIYLSVMSNALLQLPSYLVSFFLIGRCHRKPSVLVFCITSGIFSIMCFVFDNEAEGITLLFCASTACNVSLTCTTELFPTSVRNTATSVVRQAVALSAVLSPILDSAGRSNAIFSYAMFRFVIISCSIFIVCLPETKGATLCDTMDEQEVNGTRLKE